MDMIHAFCSVCGQKVGKYGPGSIHETVCPLCKAELKIETDGKDLRITVLRRKQDRSSHGQPA